MFWFFFISGIVSLIAGICYAKHYKTLKYELHNGDPKNVEFDDYMCSSFAGTFLPPAGIALIVLSLILFI